MGNVCGKGSLDRGRVNARTTILNSARWVLLYQSITLVTSLMSTMLLARWLAPEEHGKIAAVNAIMLLLNMLGCNGIVSHALQVQEGTEPQWGTYWSLGIYVQMGLFLAANLIAIACWFLPSHKSLAFLIHLASFALPLNVPHLLLSKMWERQLDFARLNVLAIFQVLACTAISLSWVSRLGAGAVIFGGNILNLLISSIVLFAILGWRPPSQWWCLEDWSHYRDAIRFGLHVNFTGFVQASRGFAEAACLPASLGLEGIAFIARGMGLFQATVGRGLELALAGTYPLLPKLASDPAAFSRFAGRFLELAVSGVMVSAGLIVAECIPMSRLLYGAGWTAVDELFIPATALSACLVIIGCSRLVLLAGSQLTQCYWLNVGCLVAVCVPIALTYFGWDKKGYLWGAAVLTGTVMSFGLHRVHEFIGRSITPVFFMASLLAGCGNVGVIVFRWSGAVFESLLWNLTSECAVYFITVLSVARIFFPQTLMELVRLLPYGQTVCRFVRL